MADRSRPRTQREELACSISSVKRAQQRQAERSEANLRDVEARAAHRAQGLQSGATETTITRSVRKHIDQSTDQLQSVLESTRQPVFVDNLSGLHHTMPLPRTPVRKNQPPKSLRKTSTRGGLASEPGVTRPPTPASEVKFSDDETFEQTVAGICTPSVTTETPKGSNLAASLVMSASTSPPASAVDAGT
jgi:hypothetical protein